MPISFVSLRLALKRYSGAAASAALLIYLFAIVDAQALASAAKAFSPAGLTLAFALILAGTLLACVRYAQVLETLGLRVPLRLAIRANILGIIGGLLFFQIVGQTLARAAVLARHGVEGPSVLVANIVERILALVWLALLACAAVVYLTGGSTLAALGANQGLIKFGLTLVAAATGAFIVARRLMWPVLRGLRTRLATLPSLRASLLSLLVHQSTLAAYVILASALAPEKPLLDIAAASAVIMFAASMPISFAGWGVRELSAIYAFQVIGIPGAEALAISLAIGLLSLAAVCLGGAASQLLGVERASGVAAGADSPKASRAVTRMASLVLPLLAGVLIYFNAPIPITGGALNLNLADPVAICGGLIFLFRYSRLGNQGQAWQAPHFDRLVLLASAALLVALLIGFSRFGYTDWAFFSRFIGWFVLLAYIATGALIVGDAGASGRRLLLDTMLAAGLAICAIEVLSTTLQSYGLNLWPASGGYPSGAAQNTNAYGVQLCVLLALLSGYPSEQDHRRRWSEPALAAALALVLANVYLAHSRAGYIAALVLLVLACVLQPVRLRTAAFALAGAALITLLATVPISWQLGASLVGESSTLVAPRIAAPSSDQERWQTIARGLELWWAHPLFGAGLGAYAEEVRHATGRLFVIHNTTVWMLAELGLIGCCAMLALFWGIGKQALAQARAATSDAPARILLLVLATAAVFQLPHDVFTQRIFWLVIGVTLFSGTFVAVRNATPRAHPSAAASRVLTSTGPSVDSAPSHAREEPQWRASRSRSSDFPTRKAWSFRPIRRRARPAWIFSRLSARDGR